MPDVQAGWLVGSQARGQARPDSDVDVAVLLAPMHTDDPLEIILRPERLADDLGGVVHKPVDVLDVERIAPITFAIVMRDAKLLVDRDPTRRAEVLGRQFAMWHDMQPHYDLQREAVREYFSRRGK